MTQDEAYKAWWHNEGSGILPLPNEDMEEFAHRMTEIAWSNGAFKEREACANICERTKADVITGNAVEAFNYATKYLAKLIRARDYQKGKTD